MILVFPKHFQKNHAFSLFLFCYAINKIKAQLFFYEISVRLKNITVYKLNYKVKEQQRNTQLHFHQFKSSLLRTKQQKHTNKAHKTVTKALS